jgi:hypothetical protein
MYNKVDKGHKSSADEYFQRDGCSKCHVESKFEPHFVRITPTAATT